REVLQPDPCGGGRTRHPADPRHASPASQGGGPGQNEESAPMTFATIVIDLDPNLAHIGPLLITWHGVFSVLGILAAARVGQYLLGSEGIPGERVYDMAVWMVIVALMGARAPCVWENYQQVVGSWLEAPFINEGAIDQRGGIFA